MKKGLMAVAAMLAGLAHAQDVQVPPQDIQAKWVGKKVFARGSNGMLVDFYLAADGTSAFSAGNFNDTGTWRLSEKGYCTTWKKVRGGQEACFTVVRRGGDTFVLNADGSVNSQILRGVEN